MTLRKKVSGEFVGFPLRPHSPFCFRGDVSWPACWLTGVGWIKSTIEQSLWKY